MKKTIILILLLLSFNAWSQNITKAEMDKEIRPLTEKVKQLRSENATLKHGFDRLSLKIDSLKSQTETKISNTSQELGSKISANESTSKQKIEEVNQSLSTNSLYGIIGVLVAILLSSLLYWLLSKQQKTDKTESEKNYADTKKTIDGIDEKLALQYEKVSDGIQKQIEFIQNHKNNAVKENEINHQFPLKVADEITLLERNVNLMDAKTKGYKQLLATVRRLKDNLAANGYEMPDLLGKPLNQGMKIIPISTIPDETLESGQEVISKIIKPQVNFNDKMIQAAQIEVSVGY